MSDEKSQQQTSTESTVAGAAKTGKAISNIAKGAAAGGAHGAAIEAGKSSAKWLIPLIAAVLLPLILVAMLPSIIFGSLSWLWDTRPSSEDINRGCTKRIKLYHCDPFNFGEVTLSASGKLEIALIQLVPLAEAEVQPKSDEDLEEKDILSRNDVKQWYTETGIALLSVLIDELNVQGHKRLVIHENGDVLVTVEGKEQTVDTIPDFPPRPAWDDLCVLAREDDISAEVRGQELAVSWP